MPILAKNAATTAGLIFSASPDIEGRYIGAGCGYARGMAALHMDDVAVDAEDHAVGIELQIIELVEQQERATVQGRRSDADRLQAEVDALQVELAKTAEHLPQLVA